MSTSTTNTLRLASFPVNPLADNLRAIAEVASLYPFRTVLGIADALGVDLAGIAPDLFDLAGSEACEAIEAELVVMAEGWAPTRSAA